MDYYMYDDATSDKSSKFILNNMSITHNVDHYEATTSNGNATLILADYTGDFEAELDMQSSTTGMGYGLFTHLNSHYDALYSKQWGTGIMIYQSNSSGSESNKRTINHNISNNWYHIKVTKQNGTVTFVFSLNGNTIYTYTQSFTDNSMLGLINNYNNVTFSFKNIIIKTL